MAVIVIAVLFRFLPHVPNMTPITALALFGGAYLPRRSALILPLSAMFLSDLVLGFSLVTPFIYGSFLLIILLGRLLRKRQHPGAVILATLTASTLFFLITNFGVWAEGMLYPHTFTGLLDAYVMGLPFFRNTLLGDLVYTGVFFLGFATLRHFVASKIFPAPTKA